MVAFGQDYVSLIERQNQILCKDFPTSSLILTLLLQTQGLSNQIHCPKRISCNFHA
jgi:hypothetical protein